MEDEIYLLSERNHPLDKAFELFRISYKQNDWDEADRIADYILQNADSLYRSQQMWGHVLTVDLCTKRHLVFYFGYGYLAKSIVLQKRRRYDEARSYIARYADLTWFKDLNHEGEEEVALFRQFAHANTYAVDLLSGMRERLPEYIQFLMENDEEVLPGLVTIMEAANQNDWDVDLALADFEEEMETFGGLEDTGNRVYYVKLLNELVLYYVRRQQYENAVKYMLEYFAIAVTMNIYKEIVTLISMYEMVRPYASVEQQVKYQSIFEGVHSFEKKNPDTVYGSSLC
ncbi:DNA-binding protein [Paenibacillus sp. JX-17]|uniref:DNA-binding protein n=1 Tax=Paenibacillus lacisoli TaxID=3064525 RepID=A0ABT9CET7_9BACL|nr:DNA-binding protein [Paenibacillus sp. JX-17]MDO7907789.1 DNA-binding protein [Paenibacillus sp. JX-17]